MFAYSHKGSLSGSIAVPGSKSQTIRGVLFGMLAEGDTVVHNPLYSRDGLAALAAARSFGAVVDEDRENNLWVVHGLNGQPKVPENVIDTMNSGTTTSFVVGISSLVKAGWVVITGDEQIRRRPWREMTTALGQLGATCIHTRPGNNCPPILIRGPIHGGRCTLNGRNSQHVSGLIAPSALLPAGESVNIQVENPMELPYVGITIDWLKKFGVHLTGSEDGTFYHVEGGQHLTGCDCLVAADWSSCAFPIVAAVCTPSVVTITDVDFTDSQGDKAVVDVLIRMGADIEKDVIGHKMTIHGGKPLHGIEIDMNAIPDALPALTVAAAYAQGDTHFINLASVREKETDRVTVMQEELLKCGAFIGTTRDTMTVHGGRPIHGAEISSHDDHRVAMAMAVCGLYADGEMKIDNPECAYVSFPGFYETMNKAGAGFELR